jgi:hypothetical protein
MQRLQREDGREDGRPARLPAGSDQMVDLRDCLVDSETLITQALERHAFADVRLALSLPLFSMTGDTRVAGGDSEPDRRMLMKRVLIAGLGALVVLFAVSASAQTRSSAQQTASAGPTVGPNFVDNDGDGICDYYQTGTRPANGQGRGNRRGAGNGTGTGTRVGPQDGTGFGRGPAAGGGPCDGTGPKGSARRGRG